MNKSTGRLVLATIASLSILAAACGDDQGAKDDATTTVADVATTEGGVDAPTTTTGSELAGGEVFVTRMRAEDADPSTAVAGGGVSTS